MTNEARVGEKLKTVPKDENFTSRTWIPVENLTAHFILKGIPGGVMQDLIVYIWIKIGSDWII